MASKRHLPIAASPGHGARGGAACDRGATVYVPSPRPRDFRVPGHLVDANERRIRYVRLSVTDRCDFACVYCMPPEGEREHARREDLLTFEEVARLGATFERLGVERLRLTGGEPLVRKDLANLVRRLHVAAPRLRLALTTNGSRLEQLARPLRDAGLESVNVSLDSLDPVRFAALTRGGDLELVTRGIDAALASGLRVKLNTVVVGEDSVREAPALVTWAHARGVIPRFIELMPVGEGARLSASAFVPIDHVTRYLAVTLDPAGSGPFGPARYGRIATGEVGFIAATSAPFCDVCNRVRITSQGHLRGCLGHPQGVDLARILRTPGHPDDLAWALCEALRSKEAGHVFRTGSGPHDRVAMSHIGG